MITLQEALEAGLTKSGAFRRVENGEWRRAFRGIFLIDGYPDSWEQRLAALVAYMGEGCAISHRASGHMLGLDACERAPLEVTVLATCRRRTPTGAVVHHTQGWDDGDLRWCQGLRITSPERTLCDLAGVMDKDRLESALESALRLRLTTLERIEAKVDARSGKGYAGCGRLRSLLERRRLHDADTDSDLELAWERVCRRGRFPTPTRQFQHRVSDGTIGYADFAWPEAKVAVEVDGWKYHFGRKRWERDGRKSNSLQLDGWIVLRFTKEDIVGTPDYVIATIAGAVWPRLVL